VHAGVLCDLVLDLLFSWRSWCCDEATRNQNHYLFAVILDFDDSVFSECARAVEVSNVGWCGNESVGVPQFLF
jgi:hypothetical protein